jgi:hypothetical protein
MANKNGCAIDGVGNNGDAPPSIKAMRGRIALQSTPCEIHPIAFFHFAKLWECARVLASL